MSQVRSDAKYAPVAIFTYNRPEHTRRMLETLAHNPEVEESPVYVFSDGPRGTEDAPLVAETREVVQQALGEDASYRFATTNRGLARSVIDGVSQLCEEYGSAIVIEDDLLLSPHFLDYMNRALSQYASEERVRQVSGYMFPVDPGASTDAFFMRFASSWGWATWQRAWRGFPGSIADDGKWARSELLANRRRRRSFDLNGAYHYSKTLEKQISSRLDSWGILWYLHLFRNQGLVLYPRETLVSNDGFDRQGTHTIYNPFPRKSKEPVDFKVGSLPEIVEVNEDHCRRVESYLRWRSFLLLRILRRGHAIIKGQLERSSRGNV